MDLKEVVKRRILIWALTGIGITALGIALIGFILILALLGMLVSSSDSSSLDTQPPSDHETFDVPFPLLPVYMEAENENTSWARLAAIHKVTNEFGLEKARRVDTTGVLDFPVTLWDTYKVEGDGDGTIDPYNPYDAVFSLARYLQWSELGMEEALQEWFGNSEQVQEVYHWEAEYSEVIINESEWIWPVIGYTYLSSDFGYRIDPITGEQGAFHTGMDIPAPTGTPVVAVQPGKVIEATRSNQGYGNLIRLQHEDGDVSWYAHLSDLAVSREATVGQGEVIGWVGSTGRSTGPHLHFEIRIAGQPVDPFPYFLQEYP